MFKPCEIGGIHADLSVTRISNACCLFDENRTCHKASRLCLVHDDMTKIVTVCPHRFMQARTVDETVRDILNRLSGEDRSWVRSSEKNLSYSQSDGTKKDAILDYAYRDPYGAGFVAVETQACYLSGKAGHSQHPDFLSSQKRLMWQLRLKFPLLRQHNPKAKIIVVIDQTFANAMGGFPAEEISLQDSEIIWLLVDYRRGNGESMTLYVADQRLTTVAAMDKHFIESNELLALAG